MRGYVKCKNNYTIAGYTFEKGKSYSFCKSSFNGYIRLCHSNNLYFLVSLKNDGYYFEEINNESKRTY